MSSLRKLCHLDWDTQTVTDLHEVPVVGTEDRFNDGKCDPMGRLWAGQCYNVTNRKYTCPQQMFFSNLSYIDP